MNENKISFNWYPGHMEKTKRKIKDKRNRRFNRYSIRTC